MIVFLATPEHGYTFAALAGKNFAENVPAIRFMNYPHAFWAKRLPRATYVFTDIERLYGWERRCAADLYRALRNAGVRCLNDPARLMTRYELLRTLHRSGINPFNIYRADDDPEPARFPVFVRLEEGHALPLSGLLADQAQLDAELLRLTEAGWPRCQMLVVEFSAEPIAEGVWCRHGSIRVGDEIHLDRNIIEDNWVAKFGTKGLSTEAMFQDEKDAIEEKRYAGSVRPAFEIACIDYGRADHSTVAGKEVIYEINTNPMIRPPETQRSPIRDAALAQARVFLSNSLRLIDCAETGSIAVERSSHLPKRLPHLDFRLRRP